MIKRYPNERILTFSDPHIPYNIEGMFDFLAETKAKHKPDRVVCTGDMVDLYNASRYPKDPEHPDSWPMEQARVHKGIKTLKKIFPKLIWTKGNHDERYFLRAVQNGVPLSILKGLGKIVGAPKEWRIVDEVTLTVDSTRDKITFQHHRGANPFLVAQRLGRTFVAGHMHSKCKVEAYNNGERVFFGCNVPTLISNQGAPFRYAKIADINPIHGCLMIEEGVPRIVVMR